MTKHRNLDKELAHELALHAVGYAKAHATDYGLGVSFDAEGYAEKVLLPHFQTIRATIPEQPKDFMAELISETERLKLYPWQQQAQSDEELARELLKKIYAYTDVSFADLLGNYQNALSRTDEGRVKIIAAEISRLRASQPDAQAIRNAALDEQLVRNIIEETIKQAMGCAQREYDADYDGFVPDDVFDTLVLKCGDDAIRALKTDTAK